MSDKLDKLDNLNFDLNIYKQYNKDLFNLTDDQLIQHFKEYGQYQMRIYSSIINFKKEPIYIFSSKYGYYLAKALQYLLFKNNILSYIVDKINYNSNNLHIILFSQKVKKYPKKYIIYQLEQKDISKWVDKKYELSILFSQKTWDYSNSNILKFPDIIQRKMEYFPIPLIPHHYLNNSIKSNIYTNTTNNILFYGSLNNKRKLMLNYLQKKLYPKYEIHIVNNLFEEELFKTILKTKIIINIHFYENAILETNRLNECLSCRRLVISEKPSIIDIENYLNYNDKVIFVDNPTEMYEKILYYLENEDEYNKYINNIKYDVDVNININNILNIIQ
jgi:hypothetical protein